MSQGCLTIREKLVDSEGICLREVPALTCGLLMQMYPTAKGNGSTMKVTSARPIRAKIPNSQLTQFTEPSY